MVNVSRRKFGNRQEAIAFVTEKLNTQFDRPGNIRIITATSKLAKKLDLKKDEVLVRWW
jgi:hypothetical protein